MRRLLLTGLLLPCTLLLTSNARSGEPAAPAALTPGAACAAIEAHDRRVYDAVAPAVVGITCRDGHNPQGGFYGTGVVVSADGLILTSTTVVPEGATNIRVSFMGAVQRDAKLVGTDEATEGSLIKVDARDLPFVPLADSAAARAGDRAYTFGNPFGTLSNDDKVSFSAGQVSGVYKLSENCDFQSKYRDLVLETEAAVNPGSDGGPLVDGQGRLLGIISLGVSERRWLGAVIPVHLIAPKFAELKDLKPPAGHIKPPEVLVQREAAWRAAVDRAAPAVVQILVDREEKPLPRPPATLNQLQQMEELRRRYATRPPGAASGVIVDESGLVLTSCFHVSGKVRKNEDAIKVRLSDGRTFTAKILGRDEGLDVVMLKIEPGQTQLPCAELSDAPLEVGNQVAVLGRSEEPGACTVNRGLVSAVGRSMGRITQVSAFINGGNLGGPAIGADGRVVGIAGHLRPGSQWGQNSGVGFVSPAKILRDIKGDLAAGKVLKPPSRTFLGIGPGQDQLEVLGAPVGMIRPGSPAAAAGIKVGDLIVQIGDAPVESWPGLVRSITGRKPGDKVQLTVKRGGETLNLEVTLGQTND